MNSYSMKYIEKYTWLEKREATFPVTGPRLFSEVYETATALELIQFYHLLTNYRIQNMLLNRLAYHVNP
jgi:hypothetical protein